MRVFPAIGVVLVMVSGSGLLAEPQKTPPEAAPVWSTPAPPPAAATLPATPNNLPEKITLTTVPTAELAQGLFEAKRYDEAIRIINKLIQLNPVQAKYDRQAALLLRVECHLALKQTKDAIDTLEAVRLAAQKSADKDQEARCSAMKFLLQRSQALSYVPATGSSKLPISVVDMATRPAAFEALYADQLAILEQKIGDARASSSITGILEVAKLANTVRSINVVVKADGKKVNASLKKLPALAAQRMKDALEQADETVRSISNNAHRMVRKQVGYRIDAGGSTPTYVDVRVGLSSGDVTTLRNIDSTCDRIPEAISDLVQALGDPEAFNNRKFKAEIRAAEVKKRALEVLKADYSK